MGGNWVLGWSVAGAVVLAAAALLLWIIATARGIAREARRALRALDRVEENTRRIRDLAGAGERLEGIRGQAEALEARTTSLAALLGGGEERQPAEARR